MAEKTVNNRELTMIIIIAVAGTLLLVYLVSFFRYPNSNITGPPTNNNVVFTEQSQIIDLVKRDAPAVVSIIASANVPKLQLCTPESSPSQRYQGGTIQGLCKNGTEQQRESSGSGFLVSPDGYILTNNHVVDDPKAEYTVILNDAAHYGQKVPTKILARDTDNDIAVLKIEINNLPYVTLGDSDKLQVGQTAVAIGYSLGEFANTVTKGLVSGLSRSIITDQTATKTEMLRGLIQTDAAINPGNSGGPLLDISGNVIGMSTAVANGQNIGFAIPINTAANDFEQVKSTGKIQKVEQGFLGIRYIPISVELQKNNKLPFDYGVLITGDTNDPAVVPGSAAEKAGLKDGDIILEANGQQLNENIYLMDLLSTAKPGDQINLKVYSDGQTKDITVTLEKKQ